MPSSSSTSPRKHHHHHGRRRSSDSKRDNTASPTKEDGGAGRSLRPTEEVDEEDQRRDFPLHECIFRGDLSALSAHIRRLKAECAGRAASAAEGRGAEASPRALASSSSSGLAAALAERDRHGNTALHLAVMLGRKEMVHLLLAHGAPVKVKNKLGWSPLAEAVSYGDRLTIANLLRKLKLQSKEQLKERKPEMLKALKELGDYVVDLRWDFTSWLPLVSKMLPSDICKISKKGAFVRLDTTLVDFTEMHWERGDITFLYRGGEGPPNSNLYVLDNKLKVYQRVRTEESDVEFDDEVDLLMSGDIISAQISTKPINFTKAQSGWIFKEDREWLK